MNIYQHLFFDLDHTLWDFEKNSEATMQQVFEQLALQAKLAAPFKSFYESYHIINENMWALYRQKEITRNELRWKRMYKTLLQFQVNNETLAKEISELYLKILPTQTHLFPHTKEVLEYCSLKNYRLHLITNGFEITQYLKIKNAGIEHYFDKMITSEQAMSMKPHQEIFQYAFLLTGAKANNSIMIGDSLEADIMGAMQVNMHQVYFNPLKNKHHEKPTFEIDCLSQLKNII